MGAVGNSRHILDRKHQREKIENMIRAAASALVSSWDVQKETQGGLQLGRANVQLVLL